MVVLAFRPIKPYSTGLYIFLPANPKWEDTSISVSLCILDGVEPCSHCTTKIDALTFAVVITSPDFKGCGLRCHDHMLKRSEPPSRPMAWLMVAKLCAFGRTDVAADLAREYEENGIE